MAFGADHVVYSGAIRVKVEGDKDLAFFSGAADFVVRGAGGEWRTDDLEIILPGVTWEKPPEVAATVSLAGISNDRVANNAGWDVYPVSRIQDVNDQVSLLVRVAARDNDGFLKRVAFQCTIKGKIKEWRPKVSVA